MYDFLQALFRSNIGHCNAHNGAKSFAVQSLTVEMVTDDQSTCWVVYWDTHNATRHVT